MRSIVGDPFGFAPSDIPQAEADALIAFYDATGGDDWTTNTGWKTDTTVGNWYGVTVAGGHVTELDLSDNNLSTTAAEVSALDLSALTGLASIDLSDNSMSAAVVGAFLEVFEAAGLTDGTIDLSGNTSPDYGTEGSPSAAAYAVGDLISRGYILTLDGTVPDWVLDLSADEVLTVTAVDFRIAIRDGEAMFFEDGRDYSAYDGAFFLLEDSAGVRARAWANGVGGGESLGSELVTNGDFSAWTDDDPDGWSINSQDTNNYITEDPAGECRLVSDGTYLKMWQADCFFTGSLYKTAIEITNVVSGALRFPRVDNYDSYETIGSYVYYYGAIDVDLEISRHSSSATNDVTFDNTSAKKCLDVPSTGLHLVSESGGTTRNMIEVETGFNPNDVTKVRIFEAS